MIKIDTSRGDARTQRRIEIINDIRAKEASLSEKFLQLIKDRTPVKSGDTRNSWTVHMLRNDLHAVRWSIRPDGEKQNVLRLEYGTRDRIEPIVPKKPGGVLVFDWPKVQKLMFLKHVHHRGIKPLGFVRRTQDEVNRAHLEIASELHARNRAVK